MDRDVKLPAEEGGCSGAGGDKEWVFFFSSLSFVRISIAIVMSGSMDENRIHFLGLPVEIQSEILKQLIEFQGDRAPIARTRFLKDIRL